MARTVRKAGVKEVPLSEIKDDLSRYLREAETQEIVITRHGKPAGVGCVQLTDDNRCAIFGRPERPKVCGGLRPEASMCGPDRDHALAWITRLERATSASPV